MLIKPLVGVVALAAFVTPALAAEFYVVQDTSTKRCTVVDKRPTASSTVVVGDGAVYTTREEAMSAMKTVKVCSDSTTGTSTTTTTVPKQ